MPVKSSVKSLPEAVRQELDQRLNEGRFTLDDLVEFLTEKGFCISRSALGRYSKSYDQVRQELRESREITQAFCQELGELPQGDMGRVLVEMLHSMSFKMISGSGVLEPRDISFMSQALKNLAGTMRSSADLELKVREAERKRLEEEQKSKLNQAAERGVLSAEAAGEALRTLFGS